MLDGLKAGAAVVVGSPTLLSAFLAAGLPAERFCYGGADFQNLFVLDERDQLRECDEPDA